MTRYIAIVLPLLLFARITVAQNPVIDSLWAVLEKAQTVEDSINLLNYLAYEFTDADLNESLALGYQALKKSDDIPYPEGKFYAHNNLGITFELIGESDSSFYYLDKAFSQAIDLGDDRALALAKNHLGIYYLLRGNHPIALEYMLEALETLKGPHDFFDPVVTYNNIGVIYEREGEIEKANTYYRKAGELAMKNGKVAFADLSFGYIEQTKGNFDKAISHYQEALQIYRKDNIEQQVGESLFYIGQCYFGKGEMNKAKEALSESLRIYHDLDLIPDEVEIYSLMAKICEAEGDRDAALAHYLIAADLAEKNGLTTELGPVIKSLADLYALKKDYAKAYAFQLRYKALNDTIYNNETKERISRLENNFELQYNKAEGERLEALKGERETTLNQRTFLAVISMLVTILVAAIAVGFYRAHQQKKLLNIELENKVKERTDELEMVNLELSQTNEELERFTYIASHDLKEPIRTISSFISLIKRRLGENSDKDLQEYMGFITQNAKKMYALIDDVLSFSRIASLDITDVGELDLKEEMIELQATLATLIEQRNVRFEIGEMPVIRAAQTHISMVFKNLVENAIKYNQSVQPVVQVSYTTEDQYFRFLIKDNGIGIKPEFQEQVFDMFRRLNTQDQYEGTGIGLAICKKIVTKYGGSIGVESEEGKGSTFFFTWPKGVNKT